MSDSVLTNGKPQAINMDGKNRNNRISKKSTRKKLAQIPTPKKLVDMIASKGKEKGFESGLAELYRECYLESPTYAHYFKDSNKDKNFSKTVWLYDSTRVIVPDVEYYHASWVDGNRPNYYILAQAPSNAEAAKDFFKLLVHVKAEGLVIADGSEEFSKFISSNFDKGGDDVATCTINENGVKNLKTVRFVRWTDSINAVELMDLVEKGRKFFGACPLKTGPMVIVCKDGAAKSGLVCFLDNELDRLAKTGRVKHTDTVKAIRFMRSNTFDSIESFELGINGIIEMCNRKKK